MKTKLVRLLAAMMALSLLAGCSQGHAVVQETTAETAVETTVETTAEIVTEPETTAEATTAAFVPTIRPVTTGGQRQVTVSTVDEFLAAIAPDTEILLNAELLDLSQATGYGTTNGEYYYWSDPYDGPELHISNVTNFTIRGTGAEHGVNVISADPRYAYVLAFTNCGNVHLSGFTAGHSKEPGYCAGGVVGFWNSQDVLVEDCGLFGCGTLGVMGESSKNIQVVNNEIYECSVGGVEFSNCNNVNVDGNTFRDLGGSVFRIYNCGSITCNGEAVTAFNYRNW